MAGSVERHGASVRTGFAICDSGCPAVFLLLMLPNLPGNKNNGSTIEQSMPYDIFQALHVEGFQAILAFQDFQASFDGGALLPFALPRFQEFH